MKIRIALLGADASRGPDLLAHGNDSGWLTEGPAHGPFAGALQDPIPENEETILHIESGCGSNVVQGYYIVFSIRAVVLAKKYFSLFKLIHVSCGFINFSSSLERMPFILLGRWMHDASLENCAASTLAHFIGGLQVPRRVVRVAHGN